MLMYYCNIVYVYSIQINIVDKSKRVYVANFEKKNTDF